MPLWLFGGGGSDRERNCPACERKVAAGATFCPSCYMVFRPEGAADLREHLRGGRIPADVYLLRKMQVEDPNTGPVVRGAETDAVPPAAGTASPAAPRDAGPAGESPPPPPSEPAPRPAPPPPADVPIPVPPASGDAGTPRQRPSGRPRPHARMSVEAFLGFEPPLPPPAQSPEDIPALLAWMLKQDPIIPNTQPRLEAIHASVFQGKPVARLGYEQHVLLQVADDLWLHATRESLDTHLIQLAAAYRRAAEAYHRAGEGAQVQANAALWQMASLASRLRMEAWVYHNRHRIPPRAADAGRWLGALTRRRG